MIATEARVKTAYILCGVVLVGFLIQLVGISLTDGNLDPLISPMPPILKSVGYTGIAISFFAPCLSIGAVVTFRKATYRPVVGWMAIVLSVILSLLEFLWTSGGHPTWFQGFAG
jgi:hypothetical protein